MPHFHERNIVEIKNIYTTFLVNILAPLLYEGIKSLYENAGRINTKAQNAEKTNPDIVNLGILKIFQLCLKGIPQWNNHLIDTETKRIKEQCKCSEWFDDLLKAVVKSYIVLLTYSADAKSCDIVNNKLHETVDVNFFIHNCYIECAKIFFNYPEIFYHGYPTLEIKRNQREAIEIIKKAIEEAIKNMLPIKMILQEYLSNDYIRDDKNDVDNNMSESHFMNLKSMVERDVGNNINNFDDGENYENQDGRLNQSLLVEESPKNITTDAQIEHTNNEILNELNEVEKNLDTQDELQKKLNDPGYITSPKPIKMKKIDKMNNVRVELIPEDGPVEDEPIVKENEEIPELEINVDNKINNKDDKFFNNLLDV